LEEIDEQNWEYAHRLFQCVAAASRPLRAEELAEFLAFDFKAGSSPTFLADWRSEDPENEVLSICSTLLVVVKPRSGSPVIQFAHFSVKEYLTSARLAETKDTISRFHVSMTPAHTIVGQACLSFLLHLDENITGDSLKDFPLAEYAAEHWVDHARFENVSSRLQDGMKRLFDPSKSHLSVWVWIYDPEEPSRRSERPERPEEARATPLHYAVVCNMNDVATFLIVEHSQDVNARGFDEQETPLLVSSRLEHVEIARVLLKHGADTEARDNSDFSPLEQVANNGHAELAQVLLEHGADANARDKTRCTPLYWASGIGQLAVAQVLLSHGADAAAQCEDNRTPLHQAKEEEVVRLLLEHGADANALDIKNRTPLHCASELDCVGAARVLLGYGVDANARDANNATPLHLASDSEDWDGRCPDVVRLLLQYGSDIHARDGEGQTPFMRATANAKDDIMQLLLEHGAEDHRM
jgi:ankyrin repeat protein